MPNLTNLDVYCADIGSVQRNNFGWYADCADGASFQGSSMEGLGDAVVASMDAGRRVALGFEAPMFIPLRDEPALLTRRREGETTVNWIGGPGAAVLATALAQVPWVLRDLRAKLGRPATATLDWQSFTAGQGAELFLWEAFVSGAAKGADHIDDARIAVRTFRRALPNPGEHDAISEPSVVSLLGAALLRTGWSSDISLLSQPCIVIKA